MTQERELARTSTHADANAPAQLDVAPGRDSRSAKLVAPEHPLVSGLLQRKAERDANGVEAGADTALARASATSGSALPGAVQRKFESSLGADLSGVRVHTGGESQAAAHAVGAKAYTLGQDIHFGAGHYDPTSAAGEHLLAHEVAHTVQQQGGSASRQNKLEVSTPFDASEHEADRAADAMVSGASATIASASGIARKVMREATPTPAPGGGAPGAAPAGGGTPINLAWSGSETKLADEPLSYFDLKWTYQPSIQATYQSAAKGKESGPQGSSGVEGEGKEGAAIKGEVEKDLDTGITGLSAKESGDIGFNPSTKKLTAGVGVSLETKWGAVPIAMKPIELTLVSWEAGKAPQGPNASMTVQATLPVHTFTTSTGKSIEVSCSGQVKMTIEPNWAKIGEWMGEHLLEALGGDGLIAGGFIVGGVMTVFVALWQIKMGEEIRQRIDGSIPNCRNYCSGYAHGVLGDAAPTGPGAAEGYALGKQKLQALQTSTGAPADVIGGLVKKKYGDYFALYSQCWKPSWAAVRQKILADYNKDHPVDSWLADHNMPSTRQTLETILGEIDSETK